MSLLSRILRNRWLMLLVLLFAMGEVANLGVLPAYIGSQESRIQRAVSMTAAERKDFEAKLAEQRSIVEAATARNAARLKSAESELAETQAQILSEKRETETQIAAYASERQRAEARKATAEARKADADRRTALATAVNSPQRQAAEA